MKETLAALYVLQQLDSAIEALKKSYASLDPGREESAIYKAAKAAKESAEIKLQAARTELADNDLELKSKEKKRASEEKLLYGGKVSNPKELTALQLEVESLERQVGRLKDIQTTHKNTLDEMHTLEKQAIESLAFAEATLRARKAAYKLETESILEKAKALIDQRSAALQPVPGDILKRYDHLRTNKQGLAIVAVEDNNSCGGCKMGLSSNLVRQIARNLEPVTCENCTRILFVVPK